MGDWAGIEGREGEGKEGIVEEREVREDGQWWK